MPEEVAAGWANQPPRLGRDKRHPARGRLNTHGRLWTNGSLAAAFRGSAAERHAFLAPSGFAAGRAGHGRSNRAKR